jgi:hypothetical protein
MSESWHQVASSKMIGNISEEGNLSRAWILRRAKDDSTLASPLWYISAYLLRLPENDHSRTVASAAFACETLYLHIKGAIKRDLK